MADYTLSAKGTYDGSNFERGIAKSKSSLEGFQGEFSRITSKIAKVAAALGGITAFTNFTKAALDSFAEYEQLVGGVDTLFKESSAQLQAYAADAYKTAGMSANEYMSTATSFSASLLQSLGGDTAKAVEYADMAIRDMSDNANKMGTDISMIQNAYQGFAKQNYMMLDNLKLGYGGTKTEMERLLADAEKLSGIHYDISSYSDIVDAIHVIQTEMGITGTTALEASETISGSINSAKAAWSNWLTGLADDNANVQELTNQLVQSVATAASNIIPRLGQILVALGTVLSTQLPVILDQILTYISENGVQMAETGLEFFLSLVTALLQATPDILAALGLLLASLVVAVGYKVGDMVTKGIELMKGVASGISEKASFVVSEIGRGISEGVAKVGSFISQFITAGKNLVAGIAQGVSNAAGEVWNAIKRICSGALDRIKSFFGIASPSKVMRKMFNFVGEGMALGLSDQASNVVRTMSGIASDIADASYVNIGAPALAVAGAGQMGNVTYSMGRADSSVSGNVTNIYQTTVEIEANTLDEINSVERFIEILEIDD